LPCSSSLRVICRHAAPGASILKRRCGRNDVWDRVVG
jgi:hypothetical protein